MRHLALGIIIALAIVGGTASILSAQSGLLNNKPDTDQAILEHQHEWNRRFSGPIPDNVFRSFVDEHSGRCTKLNTVPMHKMEPPNVFSCEFSIAGRFPQDIAQSYLWLVISVKNDEGWTVREVLRNGRSL